MTPAVSSRGSTLDRAQRTRAATARVGGVLTLAAWVGSGCAPAQIGPPAAPPVSSETAGASTQAAAIPSSDALLGTRPDLVVPLLDGQTLNVGEAAGSLGEGGLCLWLDSFGSSMGGAQSLRSRAPEMASTRLVLVSTDATRDTAEALATSGFEVAWDPEWMVAFQLGVPGASFICLDASGVVRAMDDSGDVEGHQRAVAALRDGAAA